MNSSLRHISNVSAEPEPAWRAVLESAAVEVFEMMAGVRLAPVPEPVPAPRGDYTAMVGMAGALCGMTTIRCSHKSAEKLASQMLGGDTPAETETVRDALGELCNMVAGNFKSNVASLADRCLLSVPMTVTGEQYVLQPVRPNEGFVLALSFEGSLVWISLIIHK